MDNEENICMCKYMEKEREPHYVEHSALALTGLLLPLSS